MYDKITKINNSTIQHGKMNDRIYLMNFNDRDTHTIIEDINNLAHKNGYSKIIAKIPADIEGMFIHNGYIKEAHIRKFYKGKKHCSFVSKYSTHSRAKMNNSHKVNDIINVAHSKKNNLKIGDIDSSMILKKLTIDNIEQIVDVYKKVFKTYPFPIHDAKYIQKTMQENVIYYGIFDKDKLFALSSSELSVDNMNAEMTDFAILPEYRGNNYALNLLKVMEENLALEHYRTIYTIARAMSYGMNSTFAKLGYQYSGTLINNTNISGKIESMNVWYKNL